MKFNNKLIMLLFLFVSSHAQASGGSAFMFSIFMFVFFSLIAWFFYSLAKHYTKNMENKIKGRLIRALPISLILSPAVYIEDGDFMFLPSAVVLQIESGRLIALVSILITFVFVYFYLMKKEKF